MNDAISMLMTGLTVTSTQASLPRLAPPPPPRLALTLAPFNPSLAPPKREKEEEEEGHSPQTTRHRPTRPNSSTKEADMSKRGGRVKRVMTQPINLIFRFMQQKNRVSVWLYENKDTRLEGLIKGFDEYMNVVLDDAFEVSVKSGERKEIGRLMLKGDNIVVVQPAR